MKKIISYKMSLCLIVVVAMMMSLQSAKAQTNIALNKTVITILGDTNKISNTFAVDGNSATGWASAATYSQWLYVDLGAIYDISKVIITWDPGTSSNSYATNFDIQVSNDALTWSTVSSVEGQTMPAQPRINTLDGLTGTGRFVRINLRGRAGSIYLVQELEVYGTLKYDNIALNKTITASSTNAGVGTGHEASAAVDGNIRTSWWAVSGAFASLTVNLGQEKNIYGVFVKWNDSTTSSYGTSFDIEVSDDGVAWTTVYEITGANTSRSNYIVLPEGISGYYVMVAGRGRNGGNPYSISEFSVYSPAEATTPVRLLSFNALLQKNNEVLLSWKSASEVNNNYYLLERSANAKDYSTIVKINSLGNGAHDYSYLDKNPLPGANYYRLGQVDLDGTATTLGIQNLNTKATTGGVSVFPNPVTGGNFVLRFAESISGPVSIRLSDLSGRIVWSKKTENIAGDLKISLNNALAAGVYLLQVNALPALKLIVQ